MVLMDGEPAKPLEEVFAERLKFEHDVIGHRMGWLMTLNSFLVGAMAVLIANSDKFRGGHSLGVCLLVIATLGALSNASCLFSNFWATVALRDASLVLVEEWNTLDGQAREVRRARMRLYGRDPRSFAQKKAPPSQVLHPWLFLPIVFSIFFAGSPFVFPMLSSQDRDVPMYVTLVVLGSTLAIFVALPVVDAIRNRRSVAPAPPEGAEAE
ncbi:hypothetical protein DFQ13_103661 [Actinokineospora spheciospongiae]|nr:hypothetical protein DFQ13_103661 [Actinokineospora spheciospongiae]